MESEYAIKISLTEHKHDNPQKPYYWSLTKYEGLWHQMDFGWEESPQDCFLSAIKHYRELISHTKSC